MKTEKIKSTMVCILMLIIILGCQSDQSDDNDLSDDITQIDDDGPSEGEDFQPTFINGMAATETGIPEMPYVAQHENGEVLMLTAENGVVNGAQYHFAEDQYAELFFDENDFPTRMIISDGTDSMILLFENYRETLVDVGLVYNNDFIVFRDQLLTDLGFENDSGRSASTSCLTSPLRLSCLARAAGTYFSAVGCVVSALSVPATFGGATVLAGLACAGALSSAYSLFADENNQTAATVGTIANVVGCSGFLFGDRATAVLDCMSVLSDATITILEQGRVILEDGADIIEATIGSIYTGDGDVKFTLSWDTDVDLDLYVAEPNGEIIWWQNRTSVTGGVLDVDDTDGFGPENIFWPTDQAPVGTYTVWVEMYSGDKPTELRVKPKLPGEYQSLVFRNLSTAGQRADIGTYTVGSDKNGRTVATFDSSPGIHISTPNKNGVKK